VAGRPPDSQFTGVVQGSARSTERMVITMKRATVGFAIYMLLGGLLVVGVAIYLQNGAGVLIGLGVMLLAVLFYLMAKRAQRSPKQHE
jgi:hypothetical protein